MGEHGFAIVEYDFYLEKYISSFKYETPVYAIYGDICYGFNVTYNFYSISGGTTKLQIAQKLHELISQHPEGVMVELNKTYGNNEYPHFVVFTQSDYNPSNTYTNEQLDGLFICYDTINDIGGTAFINTASCVYAPYFRLDNIIKIHYFN